MPAGTAFDKMMWRLAYLYLVVPFLIFALGWLKWFYSIPLILIVCFATWLALRQHTDLIRPDLKKHRRTIWICIALIVLWVVFSGIGQFSYQNGDHYARNAVLKDLVEQPWPLVYDFSNWQPYGVKEPGEYMLVYYIGYWMPAAVFGKLFGLQAAHVFLFLWTVLGVILVFYFTCRHLKKIRLWILFLFMLFGGMDVIPFLLDGNYHPVLHLEWWHNARQQYTSHTSQLYWVFNQAIIPWLVMAMLCNGVPRKNMMLVCALCFFYAPFPFLGLVPFAAYFFFLSPKQRLSTRDIFTFQNVVAGTLVLLFTYGYFSSVSVDKNFNILNRPFTSNLWFYTIEFLVTALLVLAASNKKTLTLVAIASLVVLSYLQYRHTPDLMMRASIPAIFMLMILSAEVLSTPGRVMIKTALITVLIIGSASSLNEIIRSLYYTGKYHHAIRIKQQQPGFELLQPPDLFRGKNPVIPTMLGNKKSFFGRTFCRVSK